MSNLENRVRSVVDSLRRETQFRYQQYPFKAEPQVRLELAKDLQVMQETLQELAYALGVFDENLDRLPDKIWFDLVAVKTLLNEHPATNHRLYVPEDSEPAPELGDLVKA